MYSETGDLNKNGYIERKASLIRQQAARSGPLLGRPSAGLAPAAGGRGGRRAGGGAQGRAQASHPRHPALVHQAQVLRASCFRYYVVHLRN